MSSTEALTNTDSSLTLISAGLKGTKGQFIEVTFSNISGAKSVNIFFGKKRSF